jgi:DNA recombination protein RmuC
MRSVTMDIVSASITIVVLVIGLAFGWAMALRMTLSLNRGTTDDGEKVRTANIEREEAHIRQMRDMIQTDKEDRDSMAAEQRRLAQEATKRDGEQKEALRAFREFSVEVGDKAEGLAAAMTGDSQVQGTWGENNLENRLQQMGFVEGQDYVKQYSETAEDGTRRRPDFVIFLPNDRQVVIDSKVSLTAWTEYHNADDDDRGDAMRRHCTSIRSHMTNLASKNYEAMESINTVDYVLMFVPIQSAFNTAMQEDPDLYREICEHRKVQVVSGFTLGRMLGFIRDNWFHVNQSRNHLRLIDESGKLHDKFVGFLDDYEDQGLRIRQLQQAHDAGRNKLVEGRGNIVKRIEDLRTLGARTRKEIPKEILTDAHEQHDRSEEAPEVVVIEVIDPPEEE